MKLLSLIQSVAPKVVPNDCKLHFACWNGEDSPLEVYFKGTFEEWQSIQKKRNFERQYIVSLVELPTSGQWLFVGVFESFGSTPSSKYKGFHEYKTSPLLELQEYAGRAVVEYPRDFRQSYTYYENYADAIRVVELKPERMVDTFPGYNKVRLSYDRLQAIITHQPESWKTALGNVRGIYAIVDTKTGKIYVGSATGTEMIWQRWLNYAHSGHGGNSLLVKLLKDQGQDYAQHFQYSILEIAEPNALKEDILARESYWKEVLCSREHGYNDN